MIQFKRADFYAHVLSEYICGCAALCRVMGTHVIGTSSMCACIFKWQRRWPLAIFTELSRTFGGAQFRAWVMSFFIHITLKMLLCKLQLISCQTDLPVSYLDWDGNGKWQCAHDMIRREYSEACCKMLIFGQCLFLIDQGRPRIQIEWRLSSKSNTMKDLICIIKGTALICYQSTEEFNRIWKVLSMHEYMNRVKRKIDLSFSNKHSLRYCRVYTLVGKHCSRAEFCNTWKKILHVPLPVWRCLLHNKKPVTVSSPWKWLITIETLQHKTTQLSALLSSQAITVI